MTQVQSTPTRKPRPPGPRQCPVCHRDLWEPCLQCRQTGLQGPGIIWCPECRQPGRGERCSRCGTKLHAPPLCTKCGGLGWLPVQHACLPETRAAPVTPTSPQQQPEPKPPCGPGSTAIERPGGPPVRHTRPDHVPPAPAILPDAEDEPEPRRRAGFFVPSLSSSSSSSLWGTYPATGGSGSEPRDSGNSPFRMGGIPRRGSPPWLPSTSVRPYPAPVAR